MKKECICPVVRTTNGLKTLLYNTLTFLNTEYFECLTIDDKKMILIYELGFSIDDIIALDIINEVFDEGNMEEDI